MADICPNCGAILRGERLRFCENCGHNLSQPKQQTSSLTNDEVENTRPPAGQPSDPINEKENAHVSSEQKEAFFFEKLKEAWSEGKVSAEGIQKLSKLREELGIDMSRAKELWEKAMESLRPAQSDDLDGKTKVRDKSHGLALYININRFYMKGFKSVLDIKVENLSDNAFDSVKVEVSSDLLGRSEHWTCKLEPCKETHKMFSVKPADAGVELVQFRLTARQDDSIYAYWAETCLPILNETREVQNVLIQANKLIDFSVTDNAKQMGNSIKVNIENLLKQDKISDVNDLITECGKLKPNPLMLELEFDPERSEQLANSLTIPRISEKIILQPERGSLTQTAALQISSQDKPVNILLVAKPSVTIGRSKKCDIITRMFPRSDEADLKSQKISSQEPHCLIDLTEKGVLLKDNNSTNGTLLNNKPVDINGRQIDNGSRELALGSVLSLSIRHHNHKQVTGDTDYRKILREPLGEMWELASKVNLNSVTLQRLNNLGPSDENGSESYCVIYRIATVGSASNCSISIEDKGLEPTHAAILYLGKRFFLENLSELTDVAVNGKTLSKSQLMPLSFGDGIRIARLDMKFQQRSQLFIEGIGS